MVHVAFSNLAEGDRDEHFLDVPADSPFQTVIKAQDSEGGWDGEGDSCFPGWAIMTIVSDILTDSLVSRGFFCIHGWHGVWS